MQGHVRAARRRVWHASVALSVDPEAGTPIPGTTAGPQLRQYTDDIEQVRILYFVTTLRTVVVVAYIEV